MLVLSHIIAFAIGGHVAAWFIGREIRKVRS